VSGPTIYSRHRTRQLLSLVVAGALLALVPFAGANNQLLQTFTVALLFAIPAVGLGLLYGEAGQMSVANGALFGIGAYTAAIGAREQVLNIWSAVGVGAMAAAIAAILIGLTALRVRGHYFLIVTFAFAELWRISTVNLRSLTGGNQGVMVLEPVVLPGLGEIESLRAFFYLALAATLIASGIVVLLRWSAFGRSLRALRENERLSISLGLNAAGARLVAFAISGALAGAGGVLYAYQLKHVGPESFGATAGIQIVLILLIGGARSAIGAILGALVFFTLPDVVSIDPVSTQIFYGVALIAIVLVSPDGLVPRAAEAVSGVLQRRRKGGPSRGRAPT
jgi:branched-chain amino acid transport system permease protein